MIKKTMISIVTLALAALLVGSSNLVSAEGTAASSSRPTIALVNEDEPAGFNGTEYHFGNDFVHLVDNDDRYNWTVVSRSVAENAYADKSVTAAVFLPRTFSHDILTLQDLDPVHAVIDYKLVDGGGSSSQVLKNQVFTILRDFNTRVVKMYFASIAGNIAGAQANMAAVVNSQSGLVDALSDRISPDLEATGKSYASSLSLARILQQLNSAWISAQNGFTDSTTRTLTRTSESLAGQQPKLSDYFALQQQIARTNVLNGNAAVSGQASADKRFYDDAFAGHVGELFGGDGAWSGLDGFSSAGPHGGTAGVLDALQAAVAGYDRIAADFNARVDTAKGSLEQQQNALTGSMRELETLETNLLREYFTLTLPRNDSNYAVDAGSLTPELARSALAEKVATSFGTSGATSAVGQYEKAVQDLIGTIPTDPAQYTTLFAQLEAHTGFTAAPFTEQLGLIRRFGEQNTIVPPALTLVDIPAGGTHQSQTKQLPVTVPAGARYVVAISLPPSVSPSRVSIVPGATACAGCVTVDPATATVTIDNTAGAGPLAVDLTYTIDLADSAGAVTLSYTAQDTAAVPPSPAAALGSDAYLLVPADVAREKIGGEGFADITAYLGNIQTAANLLHFLFGAPGESLQAFTTELQSSGDFTGHSAESVVNRYGTIDAATIRDRLSDADVREYQALGLDNISAIVRQIDAVRDQLRATAESIAILSAPHLSETYFSDSLRGLENWYAGALASVSAAPARWEEKANTVIQLQTLPWKGQDEGKPELYLDETTGPSLYRTLSELVTSTSAGATSVAARAQLITDNTAQFDELSASVGKTQAESKAVLDAMKGTIGTGEADLSDSRAFSERFSTVLSNTRASGADPERIYDVFAAPVTTKDITDAEAAASPAFDYRLIAIFVAGSLIGALIAGLVARRRRRA
ncbi:type VII secretion protein EsaA [Leifsonia xyli]|uniref:type VII secretion protein EsaA n=1 Tax=Leifsonia xyli TaxID=1575 RepID=UPI003D672911